MTLTSENNVIEGEVMPTIPSQPTLEDLNNKAIEKLYKLFNSIDEDSNPEVILACTKSLSQLNASIRGNDIFTQEDVEGERRQRKVKIAEELLRKDK